MFVRSLILASTLLGLCHAASAADPSYDVPPPAVGDSTRALLSAQRSGRQAGPELPMLGAASVLAYQRYLDSYKTKIPENFSSVLSKSGNSGSGSR